MISFSFLIFFHLFSVLGQWQRDCEGGSSRPYEAELRASGEEVSEAGAGEEEFRERVGRLPYKRFDLEIPSDEVEGSCQGLFSMSTIFAHHSRIVLKPV